MKKNILVEIILTVDVPIELKKINDLNIFLLKRSKKIYAEHLIYLISSCQHVTVEFRNAEQFAT